MADLIKPSELAVWTSSDLGTVAADPFAKEVMSKVSDLARFVGGQPTWEYDTAPFDVKMVVLTVCKRTYENPLQEVQTGIGPISSRVLDAAALLTELTESERATLARYNADGDPNNSLWVLKTTATRPQPTEPVLYVPDDDLSDWFIPMFSPGDPGDPNLYPEVP